MRVTTRPVVWSGLALCLALFSLTGCTTSDGGRGWSGVPPLYFRTHTEDSSKLVTPLYARGEDAIEESAWHVVVPFYYTRTNEHERLVGTLLGGYTHGDAGTRWLAWPLLSWGNHAEDRSNLWVIGPLSHFSWGEDAESSHVFPVYYGNRQSGIVLSPLVASWRDEGVRHSVVPLLLSKYSSDGNERRVVALLGLGHEKWGGEQRKGHLIPLYMYRAGSAFYTPLAGWNGEPKRGFIYALTPLVGIRIGDYSGGWVFPLYSHERYRATGRTSSRFLWGTYWRDGRFSGSQFMPFYLYRNSGPVNLSESADEDYADFGKKLYCLPACWYKNQVSVRPDIKARAEGEQGAVCCESRKAHGFFPLYSYSRVDGDGIESKGSVLVALYDWRSSVKHGRDMPVGETPVNRRRRVLGRLFHYEREAEDLRDVSVLWRLFRYSRTDEGTRMDILFVPVMRKAAPVGENAG